MLRVVSESLTLHTQSLINCVEQYGWMSWMATNREFGAAPMEDYDVLYKWGFEAACDVVAELVTETIARYNARCDEPMPKQVPPQIPPLPTIDREHCRIWTMEELYDEHVRMLKPNELITGALNWFLHRFWTELVDVAGDEDNCSQVIWYDRAMFHRSLKDRSLCNLYVVDPCVDIVRVAEGNSYSDLVMPVVEKPMGIFLQGDAWVLTDDISGYLLDPDDIHSDEPDTIEYFHFTEQAARFLHLLK